MSWLFTASSTTSSSLMPASGWVGGGVTTLMRQNEQFLGRRREVSEAQPLVADCLVLAPACDEHYVLAASDEAGG